jgi:hypothetical protein
MAGFENFIIFILSSSILVGFFLIYKFFMQHNKRLEDAKEERWK